MKHLLGFFGGQLLWAAIGWHLDMGLIPTLLGGLGVAGLTLAAWGVK